MDTISISDKLSSQQTFEGIREVIINLISKDYDPYVSCDEVQKVRDKMLGNKVVTDKTKWIAGGLGFYLFSAYAQSYKNKRNAQNSRTKANNLLNEKDVRDFIRQEYTFGNDVVNIWEGKSEVYLHEVGTTSYILRLDTRAEVSKKDIYALKIIKYEHKDNELINEETKGYRENFDKDLDSIPNIYESDQDYILMEFIQGRTLKEYVHTLDSQTLTDLERVTRITEIVCDIAKALRSLKDIGITHSDLSPHNIIVKEHDEVTRDEDYDITLIDLGYNYLLQDEIGSTDEFVQIQSYVAPELHKFAQSADTNGEDLDDLVKSDIYSLGIVALELLSGEEIMPEKIGYNLDLVWSEYPQFAIIIEDMIDTSPRNRLVDTTNQEIYPYIIKSFHSAHDDLKRVKTQSSSLDIFLKAVPAAFGIGAGDQIQELYRRISNIGSGNSPQVKKDNYLLKWVILCQTCHISIMLAGLAFILNDFGITPFFLNDIVSVVQVFYDLFAVPAGVNPDQVMNVESYMFTGSWREYLPGRMVALSFSLIGAQYYINIFSTIYAYDIDWKLESVIRLTSFSYLVPVGWAVFVPSHWPFCSALGVLPIVLNNYLCYRYARDASREINSFFNLPSTTDVDNFLKLFNNWWELMLFYDAGLWVIGVSLYLEIAQDEWVYALLVSIGINIIKMYRQNCVRDAPDVRSGLRRLFNGYRRLLSHPDYSR